MGYSAPPSPWTSLELVTVAQMQIISDDIVDLDRRSTATSATVATQQTTTSATYTDLATSGPAVTVTVGTSGHALVILTCQSANNTSGNYALMGFAVSGATTVAASDSQCAGIIGAANNQAFQGSAVYLVTGLTAGSNTFTAKYRVDANTGTFVRRNIVVIPLGS